MEIDFDKEIDSLLRRASRRGERGSFEASAREEIHLDADELSAFAENSLPVATRSAFAAHLADCARCRKIAISITTPVHAPLAESSFEVSARQAIAEDTSSPVTSVTAATPEIKKTSGWRERLSALFAPPVLIYGVPALVLLFVGIAAFVALRTDRSDEQLTVARREEPAIERMIETNDNSNMATANPSGTNGASSNANMSGMNTTNANTMNSNRGTIESNAANGASGAVTTERRAGNVAPSYAPPPPTSTAPQTFGTPPQNRATDSLSNQTPDDRIAARTGNAQPNARARNMNAGPMPQQQTAPVGGREARDESERGSVAPASPSVSESTTTRRGRSTPSRPAATGGRAQADGENDGRADTDAPTRAVAGRTFRRQGGAWVDTAYRAGAATVNVARGSEQFRALAADEPVIGRVAAQLNGEVIVVVRGRAYRIR